MEDRSKVIFGNVIRDSDYRKAEKSKRKFMKKFGDDSGADYPAVLLDNPHIGDILGVRDIRLQDGPGDGEFDLEKGIVVGNIRMGFGHYRISMAIASAAHSMGYIPYWMDLNSYSQTTCTKVISAQNDLYSLGSRISQKSRLFNKLVWEPMNYEGFRKLSYNASDQKNAELMAPVFRNVPKEIPVVGTHVWPAQAAIHAGMKYVVNAMPDNWPMALHLAEGSIHTIQTRYAYQGYRILNGMQGKDVLKPMPPESLVYTGHYVDHELVENIEADCSARMRRKREGKPIRFLLTIGGAGPLHPGEQGRFVCERGRLQKRLGGALAPVPGAEGPVSGASRRLGGNPAFCGRGPDRRCDRCPCLLPCGHLRGGLRHQSADALL